MLNNKGLVEFVKRALNERWGYVYGTYGQVLTVLLYEQKLRQFPSIKTYDSFIKSHWIGKRTADCVGLIKCYYWSESGQLKYNASSDVTSDGMYNKAKEKGSISSIPDIPGLCVYKSGHIGVYIGNGRVIEARGTKYGVIESPLKGQGAVKWTHWLKCPFINYVEDPVKPAPTPTPTPGKAEGDSWIKILQQGLNEAGFTDESGKKLEVDGWIGVHTRAAAKKCVVKPGMKGNIVKYVQHFVGATVDGSYGFPPKYHDTYDHVCSYQRSKKLQVDGKVGPQTWTSILG
jgi:hypothetical protein